MLEITETWNNIKTLNVMPCLYRQVTVTVPDFILSIIRKTYMTGLVKNKLNNKLLC
jgi:hypothetical protein